MQNQQDVLNMFGILLNDPNPNVTTIEQTPLDTTDVYAPGKLMMVRLRGVGVNGAVSAYYKNSSVLLIDGEKNFDTGGIYLICDTIDAIGVAEGVITVEGYYW